MLCCPINNYFDFMQIQSINTQPTRRRHTETNALAKYGKAQHHIISIADVLYAVCCNWGDESYVNRGAPLFTINLWLCFQRFVFTFCWIICYLPVHLNTHINNRAPHFHNSRECRSSNSLPWRRCFHFHRSLSCTAETVPLPPTARDNTRDTPLRCRWWGEIYAQLARPQIEWKLYRRNGAQGMSRCCGYLLLLPIGEYSFAHNRNTRRRMMLWCTNRITADRPSLTTCTIPIQLGLGIVFSHFTQFEFIFM